MIYKTISLPVVLYGCETWSLTLRVEHKLRVFENGVLRIFGPKRDEVMGRWRKLHNEEADGECSMNGGGDAYRLLVGRPEGKRPLGSYRRRGIDNIKMDLLETGLGGVDWIGLAQNGKLL
jgi:hypothetical protein